MAEPDALLALQVPAVAELLITEVENVWLDDLNDEKLKHCPYLDKNGKNCRTKKSDRSNNNRRHFADTHLIRILTPATSTFHLFLYT